MPSGAKKRKAAKKKLQKKVHNNNSSSNKGSDSLSQGSDDPRSHDERDNGGVEVEREGNVEGGGVKNHDEVGAKEVSFGEGNGVRETKKDINKNSSSSSGSSSSSSDDDAVEERTQEPESENVEVSIENSGGSAVVNEDVEESIPLEESVKEVVSLPQVSSVLSENVLESGLKQNIEESLQPLNEKINVASKMENIVEKVIPVVDRGAENISELVSVTVRHDEGLLPQSSGVKDVEGCCANDDCKTSATHKYAEQQPLLSSAPITVWRTSWMDCCGLFEVFSGGSSR